MTLRGFSFTSAWMEKCKQSTKTSVQNSKGIWKKMPVSKSKIQKAIIKPAVEKTLIRSQKAKKALAFDKTKDDRSSVTGNEEVHVPTSNGRKTRDLRSRNTGGALQRFNRKGENT